MSIVQAYKSDSDGLLFEDLQEYRQHLKYLARHSLDKKKQQKLAQQRMAFIQHMFDTVSSPEELVRFIHDNIDFFIKNSGRRTSGGKLPVIDKIYIAPSYDKQARAELQWSNTVSNSHSAPMGKKTNWGKRNKDEPSSYPGWNGVIWIEGNDATSSDLFRNTGINTGSGNGGRDSRYTIEIFAHDFKKMAYHEMLADFEKGKRIDPQRVIHVMEVSRDYFDFTCPRLNVMLDTVYVQSPEFHAKIMDGKLEAKKPCRKAKI